jgi:phosphonate transport system permease protein
LKRDELALLTARKKGTRRFLATGGALAAVFLASAIVSKVDLIGLFSSLGDGLEVLGWMFPPKWSSLGVMIDPAFKTVEMAFLGTVLGAALSFFIGLAAAGNVAHPVLRRIARSAIQLERALPDLVVTLLFVAAVGFGPFAGVMALGVCSIGMLGKLTADAIEEVDPRPLEALESTGATKMQIIRHGILPQVMPTFVSDILYRFDINIRFSVLLGAVGAGGIGYVLILSMGTLDYRMAMMALIVIMTLVVACQKISDYLKKKIVGTEVLK